MGTFGENLMKARNFYGYTRPQAAELLGTNKFSYRNWERDENYPSMESLIKISQLFRVSIDWLVGNELVENKEKGIEQKIAAEKQKAESK